MIAALIIRQTPACQSALVALVICLAAWISRSTNADDLTPRFSSPHGSGNGLFSSREQRRQTPPDSREIADAAGAVRHGKVAFSTPSEGACRQATGLGASDSRVLFSAPEDSRGIAVPRSSESLRTNQAVAFSAASAISVSPQAEEYSEPAASRIGRFSFSAVSDQDRHATCPEIRANPFWDVPVSFSLAENIPYQSSWASFLQDDGASDSDVSGTESSSDQTLGEAPEETNANVQFLRREAILLKPGQYQFDLSYLYLSNESDFVLIQSVDNQLQIGELVQRTRLMSLGLGLRLGVTPGTQFFVNVPFGWSNAESIVFSADEVSNTGGIGDVSLGFTRQLKIADEYYPNLLGTVAISAPTGNSQLSTSLATPGSSLGQGFWTTTVALTFTRTYDPVVIYGGLGYQWRFNNSFQTELGELLVRPGDQAFYRFGVGFAVNPRVTMSAAFRGAYYANTYISDVLTAGSNREPMQFRLATTIVRKRKSRRDTVRTIEPYVDFGLTPGAIDSIFGINFTY